MRPAATAAGRVGMGPGAARADGAHAGARINLDAVLAGPDVLDPRAVDATLQPAETAQALDGTWVGLRAAGGRSRDRAGARAKVAAGGQTGAKTGEPGDGGAGEPGEAGDTGPRAATDAAGQPEERGPAGRRPARGARPWKLPRAGEGRATGRRAGSAPLPRPRLSGRADPLTATRTR